LVDAAGDVGDGIRQYRLSGLALGYNGSGDRDERAHTKTPSHNTDPAPSPGYRYGYGYGVGAVSPSDVHGDLDRNGSVKHRRLDVQRGVGLAHDEP